MKSLRQHRGEKCLNCGHPLDVSDKYCPHCGQLNSDKKLSAKDMLIEFLGSIFSYDSKLLVSLRALLFSPAKMTKEYLSGKRVKYVNPFRIFISVAILYFIVSSITTDNPDFRFEQQTDVEQKEVEGLINHDISKNNDSIKQKTIQKDSLQVTDTEPSLSDVLDENPNLTFDEAVSTYGFEDTMQEEFIFLLNKNAKKTKENPDAFIDYIKSKFPFFMFFFIPVVTLILKLLYIRREFTYTDHLVFNYYLSSTLFFLLIITSIISFLTKDYGDKVILSSLFVMLSVKYLKKLIIKIHLKTLFKLILSTLIFISLLLYTDFGAEMLAYLIFLIYVIIAFKYFYQQAYFKTIVKLTLFAILYSILFGIFVLVYIILLILIF